MTITLQRLRIRQQREKCLFISLKFYKKGKNKSQKLLCQYYEHVVGSRNMCYENIKLEICSFIDLMLIILTFSYLT